MNSDFANLKRYASENEKLAGDSERVVFFGDSITEFWTSKNSHFFKNPHYINRGISSQTTSQMRLRFQQDVIDLQPKTVVLLAGINDIAENNGPISLETIFENLAKMMEMAFNNTIEVVLCSVLPAQSFSWSRHIDPIESIIRLNKMLTSYAQNQRIVYVDYYSQMIDASNGLDSKYTDDGVHPSTEGYKKMEQIITPFLTS